MPIALWSSTACVLPWVVPAAPPGVALRFWLGQVRCEHGWEQPLGGLKSSSSPGVNEGVRHQRRCTTSLPFAPGYVIHLFRALHPFGASGGRGNCCYTRGTNIGCGTSIPFWSVRVVMWYGNVLDATTRYSKTTLLY